LESIVAVILIVFTLHVGLRLLLATYNMLPCFTYFFIYLYIFESCGDYNVHEHNVGLHDVTSTKTRQSHEPRLFPICAGLRQVTLCITVSMNLHYKWHVS